MNEILIKLVEEFDETGRLMTKALESSDHQERYEALLHYRNGLRFAIDLLEKSVPN